LPANTWDPRTWGLWQIAASALVVFALPVLGVAYGPSALRQVFFLLEIVAIGAFARILATALRRHAK
jgi:hypothetical protein